MFTFIVVQANYPGGKQLVDKDQLEPALMMGANYRVLDRWIVRERPGEALSAAGLCQALAKTMRKVVNSA